MYGQLLLSNFTQIILQMNIIMYILVMYSKQWQNLKDYKSIKKEISIAAGSPGSPG